MSERKHISGVPFSSLLASANRINLENSYPKRNRPFFPRRFKCVGFSKDTEFKEEDTGYSTDTDIMLAIDTNTLRDLWYKNIVKVLEEKYEKNHLMEAFGPNWSQFNPIVARKLAKGFGLCGLFNDESDREEPHSQEEYECQERCEKIYKEVERFGTQLYEDSSDSEKE